MIEYTEKTFKTAVVNRHGLSTTIDGFGDSIKFVGWTLPNIDVPEVCEAMMTLAGHEWPVKAVYSAPNEDVLKAAAERIIARLEQTRSFHSNPSTRDDYADAIRIVREECGVAE